MITFENLDKALTDYASKKGKHVDELTSGEKEEAILNILGEIGKFLNDIMNKRLTERDGWGRF
jgi:hypothetical protein